MGLIYRIKGHYNKAIEFFQESLIIAQQINDSEMEKSAQQGLLTAQEASSNSPQQAKAEQLFQQGFEQYSSGQFQAAIQSWEETITILQEMGDRQGQALTLMNLGNAYNEIRYYAKAIQVYQQALSIAQEIDNRKQEGFFFTKLSSSIRIHRKESASDRIS